MGRRRFYLACFFLHFSLILLVCSQQTFWIVGEGYGLLPHSLDKYWQKAENVPATFLGQNLSASNPVRQGLTVYLFSTGIESGYGFFAPNVPNSYKLVFEIHYRDGRIEYDLPHVGGRATGLRFTNLLEEIGRAHYEPLRELMLKMLAYSTWQTHPHATTIRAVFGYVDQPSVIEVGEGKKESYNFLYAYDFSFPPQPVESSLH